MSHKIAVVYLNMDGTGMACKRTDMANIDRLTLDADERYLRVAVIKDFEGEAGGPFIDNESGHDAIGLAYNPNGGAGDGRLLITKTDIGPDSIKQSSWTNPATGLPAVKFNKAHVAKLNSALTQTVQFALYDGNDFNQRDNEAQNWDVINNCQDV